jgi:hypothetical protein
MSTAVDKFVAGLRGDPAFADLAADIARAFAQLDRESDGNPDGAALYEALHYTISRPDRLLREKVAKCLDLVSRRGPQSGRIKDIVGWR